MYIELTTGNDSFRAHGASQRRNCRVQVFTRVPDAGDNRKVVPLFEAYRLRLPEFRNSHIVGQIPATDRFGMTDCGQWFRTRYEVVPGTELMVEYRHRTGGGQFAEDVEYLLLIADETAPLWQIRLDLPRHQLSSVPHVFFDGRFRVVEEPDDLSDEAGHIWTEWMMGGHTGDDEDDAIGVLNLVDPNMPAEDQFFTLIKLEEEVQPKARTVTTNSGRIKIRRARRVRTRG